MPYLKLAAMMLLVLVIGIPAAPATPESQRLSEAASPRLNLDYLAPEVRSMLGPDAHLAKAPNYVVEPLYDPEVQCKRDCEFYYEDALRTCFTRYDWGNDSWGYDFDKWIEDCRTIEYRKFQNCKKRCELTPT